MSIIRRIIESPLDQGEDERVAYALTTTPWGSSPSSASVVLKSYPDMVDVTSTLMTGLTSVVGDVITSPIVHSLVPGTVYRIEFEFVVSGNTVEAYALIRGEE